MKKIAIEEHFTTRAYQQALRSRQGFPRIETVEDENHNKVERLFRTPQTSQPVSPRQTERMLDLGTGRIAEMDHDGIDMQVMMLAGPTVEELDQASATDLARDINDELAEAVRKNPSRLAGFASLAYGDPVSAAKELERSVTKLGLKGAKINSHVGGQYLDDRKFWPLWEAAQASGMPVYIHPKEPPKGLAELLGYGALAGAMYGFMADTSLHALRLMCGGVFDAFPDLKIILGHLGEGLPFWMWRIDNRWAHGRRGVPRRRPGEYFMQNFWVTTSGMFGQESFECVHKVLGADRILFAVDWPYESNEEAVRFIESAPIPEGDRHNICHLNAERLLKL